MKKPANQPARQHASPPARQLARPHMTNDFEEDSLGNVDVG